MKVREGKKVSKEQEKRKEGISEKKTQEREERELESM